MRQIPLQGLGSPAAGVVADAGQRGGRRRTRRRHVAQQRREFALRSRGHGRCSFRRRQTAYASVMPRITPPLDRQCTELFCKCMLPERDMKTTHACPIFGAFIYTCLLSSRLALAVQHHIVVPCLYAHSIPPLIFAGSKVSLPQPSSLRSTPTGYMPLSVLLSYFRSSLLSEPPKSHFFKARSRP